MGIRGKETKDVVAPKVKEVLNKYGLKGSLKVRDAITLVLTIQKGPIDFFTNLHKTCRDEYLYATRNGVLEVNPYHFEKHFSGRALKCLEELIEVMHEDPKSTDIFKRGCFVDINIGKQTRPYQLVAAE